VVIITIEMPFNLGDLFGLSHGIFIIHVPNSIYDGNLQSEWVTKASSIISFGCIITILKVIDHSTNQDPEIMSKRKLECTENELEMAEKKFKRSCEQIVLLNDKLDDLQNRYDTAKRDDRRSFRNDRYYRTRTIYNNSFTYANEITVGVI
jgi:ribosomal protein S21